MKKKQLLLLGLVVYLATVAAIMTGSFKQTTISFDLSESELGKMCVASVYPTITRGAQRVEPQQLPQEIIASDPEQEPVQEQVAENVPSETENTVVDTQNPENPTPATTKVEYDKPLVILYHTHATESYQPVSEGNFHTLGEEGSVREVGNVLTAELNKLGIEVVHDKTLHDSPSYNQSYSRSLETSRNLLKQYPSAVFVVDLHRDAAAYSGGQGKTVTVNGETVAKYSLVVGQGNPNVKALTTYANAINKKAEEMYPGFGGRIIEKAYKFNQHVSDYHILLEVGNNQNNIRETKNTAKYFAQVLAAVIKDIQQ